MSDDTIRVNLTLNENTVTAVENRVQNLINRLNNQNVSLNINGRNLDNIINRLNTIQQQMQTINSTPIDINANLTQAQQQYRLETERLRVTQQLELSRQRTLQTENQAITALAHQNRTLNINNNVTHQIEQGAQNIGNNMNVAGGHARDFVDYLADGVRYMVVYRSLYEIMNQIGEAFSEMKNVDSALIQVRKTTGMSQGEIESIRKASYGVATEYGRTASEYLESVSEFARAGYKQQSTELGKLSLLTQNVGDVSAESADKMLLAVDAAYQLEGNVTELTNVVNALNNIANKNPTSMQKMADGLQVSASMAKTAGMDVPELTALIGTGTAVTQREGAEIARAIRTIVMNIRAVKGELEDGTIIDDDSIAKAEAALKGVGVSTKEVVNGVRELRNPMKILDELAEKWHTLGTEAQSVLTESLANKRQANVLSGILDNWAMVEKMQTEYFNSANSAIEENILYLEGWEAKSKVVSAKWTEYVSNLADTKVITGTLNALYGVLAALDTPVGRLATQIILVNTALAVTGRLWQALRARSIVADILSMGVAERNLGTAIQLVTGHLDRQIAQWAASPFGMATIAVAGITLITSAIEKNSQKLEENAQKAGEAFDKVKSDMNELDGLIKEYNDLQISNKWNNTPIETKKQLHEDINRLLGDEADKIDILNGKYKETTEELFKQRMAKLPEEEKTAFDNEQAKGKSLWNDAYWDNNGMRWSYADTIITPMSNAEKEYVAKYADVFGKGAISEKINIQLQYSNFDDLLYKYDEAKKMLQEMYTSGLGETGLYKSLNEYISGFDTKIQEYRTAVAELNNTKTGQKLANYINQNVGGYIDDLDEYTKVVDWIKGNFTDEDKDNALGFLNAYFSEYADKVSKTNNLLGQGDFSASLDTLANASDKIKTLSTAFKELSDDGYITTKTLGEIKTATELSDDEWKSYEAALMNAKKGSAEFNQVMSDLTYKILDATFKKDGLVNATEAEIAAVLRENGVTNASAVAHDYATRTISAEEKAKVQNRIQTALANQEIDKLISNLSFEAAQCGVTADAFRTLAIQMVAVNNQNLSFEQQTAALRALGIEADLAAAKIAGVNGVKNQKYSQPRGSRGNVDRRGGLITSYGQEVVDGQVYLLYYGENGAVIDREKIGGTAGATTPTTTPNYSGATSGSGSSSSSTSTPDKPVYQKFTPKEFEEDNSYSDLFDELLEEKKTALDKLSSEYDSLNAQLDNALLKGNFDEVNILRKRIKENQDEYQKLLADNAGMARADMKVLMEKLVAVAPEFEGKEFSEIAEGQYAEVLDRLKQEVENQKRIAHNLEQANEKAKVDLENAWADESYNLKLSNENSEDEYYKQREQEYKQKKELLEAEDTSNFKAIADAELVVETYEQVYDTLKNYYDTTNEWSSDWWETENQRLEDRNNQLNDALSQMERHIDEIKDGIQDQIDKVDELKEANQDQIDDLDDEIQKENGILSIMQKQFEVQNALSDAKHEAVKAIATSRVAYKYLDEETRKSIYNEDDYKKEIAKIKEVGSEIDRLTNDFIEDINEAYEKDNLYLIESITAEYERQCEFKERELEMLQAEIDLQKKQDELNNVLAEKNVRILKDGQWQWTYNADAARQATEELAEAEHQLKQLEIQQEQQYLLRDQELKADKLKNEQGALEKQIELYDKEIEAYEKQIEMLDEQTENLRDAVERITDPLADIGSLLDTFADVGIGRINNAVDDLLDAFSRVTNKSYDSVSSSSKSSSSSGNKISAEAILSSKVSKPLTHLKGYASGTKSSDEGWVTLNELKNEGLLTKTGAFIPMGNLEKGTKVFNGEQMENLWDWSKLAPTISEVTNTKLPKFVPREREVVNTGNTFTGDFNIYEPADFNAFMDEVNTKIKMWAPITNNMKR